MKTKNQFRAINVLLMVILLVSAGCGNINAQGRKFHPATITKIDGTKMECVAREPATFHTKFIIYRAGAADKKKRKILSDSIRTIIYHYKNDRYAELDHYPVKYIYDIFKNKDKTRPYFMNVVSRGPVTLYRAAAAYFCIRAGEKFASNLSMGVGIYGSSFKKVTGDYFADNPELAEKIRNGEDGYKPQNIEKIVEEYNAWKTGEKESNYFAELDRNGIVRSCRFALLWRKFSEA